MGNMPVRSRLLLNLMLGLFMVVFAAISIRDGMRITAGFRGGGTFDVLGPDRYLLSVAVFVGALGLGFIVQSLILLRRGAFAGERAAEAEEGSAYSIRHVALVGLLVIYAAMVPVAGYTAASFVFFVVTFRVMGLDNWRVILPWSLAATALFYVAFVHLADMPLPTGLLGTG